LGARQDTRQENPRRLSSLTAGESEEQPEKDRAGAAGQRPVGTGNIPTPPKMRVVPETGVHVELEQLIVSDERAVGRRDVSESVGEHLAVRIQVVRLQREDDGIAC